jgi:type III secretion protein K
MAAAQIPSILWQHPLAEALLRFDRLPSLLLHPSRLASLFPAAAQALLGTAEPQSAAWRSWHRHGSSALARELALQPVVDLAEPGLPLALLGTEAWDALLLLAGATLAGPQLRRVIAREQVQAARAQLGAAFDFVRSAEALALYPGKPGGAALAFDQLESSCRQAGALLLARAFDAASTAVAARGRLRLPQGAVEAAGATLGHVAPAEALQLSYSLIERIDPAWLSSFPAAR